MSELHTSLLDNDNNDSADGYVDHKGCPVKRSKSGRWRSTPFILAAGMIERFAYYGIESNLISFLTGPLEESVATAAANVNTWIGVVSLGPIFGAFLADSFIGNYRTTIISSILYILGIGFLTLSATIITSNYTANEESGHQTQVGILFFSSLYVVALAQGYKTCIQAFGADQFDGKHQEESKAKSSYFNWWLCGLCIGSSSAHLILHYIQDNISWEIGFGIPCLAMIVGLILFLLGNRTYRFRSRGGDEESNCERISQRLSKVKDTLHNIAPASSNSEKGSKEYLGMIAHQDSHNHKFLSNALPAVDDDSTDNNATSKKTKDPKKDIKLLFIWMTCLTYTIAYAQSSTFFTKQATTVNRSIGPSLSVPAATLKTFIPISIMLFIPLYDQILVPVTSMVTRYPSGITMLQRIGIGMVISVLNMVIAALIEKKRLEIAQDYGLVDIPNATVPMSFWWLVPQYILFGIGDVFVQVGMQEFFYDQAPTKFRSVGLSFHSCAIGIGNFLSSFLVTVINSITSENGENWFSDNLNRAHIDYFFWVLAGLGAVGFVVFVHISKSYIYEEQNDDVQKCSPQSS